MSESFSDISMMPSAYCGDPRSRAVERSMFVFNQRQLAEFKASDYRPVYQKVAETAAPVAHTLDESLPVDSAEQFVAPVPRSEMQEPVAAESVQA